MFKSFKLNLFILSNLLIYLSLASNVYAKQITFLTYNNYPVYNLQYKYQIDNNPMVKNILAPNNPREFNFNSSLYIEASYQNIYDNFEYMKTVGCPYTPIITSKTYNDQLADYFVLNQSVFYYNQPELSTLEQEILNEINQIRQANNLGLLRNVERLNYLADVQTVGNDQASVLFHGGMNCQSSYFMSFELGIYSKKPISEIIQSNARGDAKSIVGVWMNSPGHKAAILNRDYQTFGVGSTGSYFSMNFGYGDEQILGPAPNLPRVTPKSNFSIGNSGSDNSNISDSSNEEPKDYSLKIRVNNKIKSSSKSKIIVKYKPNTVVNLDYNYKVKNKTVKKKLKLKTDDDGYLEYYLKLYYTSNLKFTVDGIVINKKVTVKENIKLSKKNNRLYITILPNNKYKINVYKNNKKVKTLIYNKKTIKYKIKQNDKIKSYKVKITKNY